MKKVYINPSIDYIDIAEENYLDSGSIQVGSGDATEDGENYSKQRNRSTYSHENLGWDY